MYLEAEKRGTYWSIRFAVYPLRAAYGAQWFFFFIIGLIMRIPCYAMESKMSKGTFTRPLISFICILKRYRLFVLFIYIYISNIYLPTPFCFTLEILLHICWGKLRDEHSTKGDRRWNVLEIARLPLAGLQRTMQFSRIMQRRRSFAAGNFYRLDRIDGSNERLGSIR